MDEDRTDGSVRLVAFTLDDRRFALHLAAVERVLPAAALTPLPNAPPVVLGVLDVAGRVLPVVDVRQRFALPERDMEPTDRLIVTHTATRDLALVADAVAGVLEVPDDKVTRGETLLPGLEYVQGIVRLDDGLVLIHDVDTFLALDEATALDDAMQAGGTDG